PFLHYFSFPDTASCEIYTLSLHDALPIYWVKMGSIGHELRHAIEVVGEPAVRSTSQQRFLYERIGFHTRNGAFETQDAMDAGTRSEEHTSELQSLRHLVCRLLLEKKKKKK